MSAVEKVGISDIEITYDPNKDRWAWRSVRSTGERVKAEI